MKTKFIRKKWQIVLFLLFINCCFLGGCVPEEKGGAEITSISELSQVPEYFGDAYIEINNNVPFFTENEKKNTKSFENYSKLDAYGRCGQAYANICRELQPDEERGAIGNVRPSGWHTVKYNGIIDGNYLYNRCHLIGFQLAGENANKKNLITGTRYMNVTGMLPFENKVDDYVDETGNHVLYRVTPYFEGDNLVAGGVLMEAWSVEDAGAGICFNVYCYNVQPGIEIDYSDGSSKENSAIKETADSSEDTKNSGYVWVSGTGEKYHKKNDCGTMNPDKADKITEKEAKKRGLDECSRCFN